MCGIVGFVSNNKNEELISNLSNSLQHRGPDKISYKIVKFNGKYLHLGSSRLSITGLIDGDMPMIDEQGNALIYNGEIYELDKMKSKYSIQSNSKSDTRFLFNFLKENSTNHLSDLNGMFAFCFYDKKNETIHLVRDRFGIKPLYFGYSNNYDLYFCSEIKPLIDNKILGNHISHNAFENFILFGGIDTGESIIDNLHSVEPGNSIAFNSKGFEFNSSNINEIEEGDSKNYSFTEIFKETLDDQLTAEVPVNILLSGGIDSTLIATFASKYTDKKVTAYSLGFDNPSYNEQSKAEAVSKDLNIELKKFIFPSQKNEEIIDEVLLKLPEPIADPSIVPTYYLNKEVSKFTKVVISGDGADELFGGYQWYRAAKISKLVPYYGSLLIEMFQNKLSNSNNSYISLKEKLKIFNSAKNSEALVKLLFWQNYLPHIDYKKRQNIYRNLLNSQKFNDLNNINHLSEVDIKNYMYTNILKKSDLASMLNSLEVRPVFLDNRMYRHSKNLLLKNNVTFLNEKKYLKKQLVNELKNYSIGVKHGFSHDFGSWIENVATPYLNKNWLELDEIRILFNYLEKTDDNNYLKSRYIWRYYSFLKWIDNNQLTLK